MLIFKENWFVFFMNRQISAIPAQCRRCGELFDLTYDLAQMSEERFMQELMRSVKNPRAALCWDCRQKW